MYLLVRITDTHTSSSIVSRHDAAKSKYGLSRVIIVGVLKVRMIADFYFEKVDGHQTPKTILEALLLLQLASCRSQSWRLSRKGGLSYSVFRGILKRRLLACLRDAMTTAGTP